MADAYDTAALIVVREAPQWAWDMIDRILGSHPSGDSSLALRAMNHASDFTGLHTLHQSTVEDMILQEKESSHG